MVTTREPSFAHLLRRYRKASGLSQEALARRALMSRRGISDLERAATQAPRRDTVELLSDALDLTGVERAEFHAAAQSGHRTPPRLRAMHHTSRRALPPAPFIGRSDDLAHIGRFLAGEEAPMLLLVGEPGIGKTRLLREATTLARAAGWATLEGSCSPGGEYEPFAPLVEALAHECATAPAAQLRASLRGCAWLTRLLPELAERGIAPPQWTLPPEQERRLIFAAVARFLTNVAGPSGTLLVLDDLQWAGDGALDLLAALMRAQPERPLRVLGVYRDTETHLRDPLRSALVSLAGDGALARRRLEPLSRDEADILLAALLKGVEGAEPPVIERMLQRSGGVPFFLVSCARGLRMGALSGTVESVPWDAAQSVRIRAAALPAAARRLLGVASVAGRVASRALLADVVGCTDDEALSLAEAVCETRLMREEGPSAYAFTHDIIREVVYGELSAGRRQLAHRRVAESLARGEGQAAPEIIAYHYEQAGDPGVALAYRERAHPLLEWLGDRQFLGRQEVVVATPSPRTVRRRGR